jgi:hypothetical protein
MPMKLNVGICRKIGQPDFGSYGASCYVEVELDKTLVISDQDSFQDHVQQVFAACRQAVHDELVRQHKSDQANGQDTPSGPPVQSGQNTMPRTNGRNGRNGHQATEKQQGYLQQLAGGIHGLGTRKLEKLTDRMFGKPVAALTSLDASGLIDTLKDIKAGEIDLSAALNGAPS